MIAVVAMKSYRGLICSLALLLTLPSTLLADARSEGDRGIAEFRKGNLIEAMQLLEKSATQGYIPAQTTLAYILDAAEWYLKAARLGDEISMQRLNKAYTLGHLGLPVDPQQAATWNDEINKPE